MADHPGHTMYFNVRNVKNWNIENRGGDMNDRIEELARQVFDSDIDTDTFLYYEVDQLVKLIIKECADKLDDGGMDGLWARSVLYEHFGIEE